jgi:PEP-CTERM motif
MKMTIAPISSAIALVLAVGSVNAESLQTWRLADIYGSSIDFLFDLDAPASTSPILGGHTFNQAIKSVTFDGQNFSPISQSVTDGAPGLSTATFSAGVPSGTYQSKIAGISFSVTPTYPITSDSYTSLASLLQNVSVQAESGKVLGKFTYPDNSNPFVTNGSVSTQFMVSSFSVVAVPEPSAFALMALGMLGIATLAVKSRRR